jgi:eukaryotic-like serine/threonine-protein kinase
MRIALAAGVGVVLLIATVSWAMWDRDTKQTPQSQRPSAPASPTRSPGTDVSFGGMSLLGPAGWKPSPAGNGLYVDIVHPSDADRRIRVNAVATETNARGVLEYAANNTLRGTCVDGLETLDLRDVELAGAKGAELEFLCTPKGKAPKHGRWRIAVIDGKMRHVYLLTWQANYEQDNAYFETAVHSFRVG